MPSFASLGLAKETIDDGVTDVAQLPEQMGSRPPILPPPHLPQKHPLWLSLSAGSPNSFSASSPEKKRGLVSTTRTSGKSLVENSTLPPRFSLSLGQNSFFLGNLG